MRGVGGRSRVTDTLGSQEFPKLRVKDCSVGRETGSVGDIIEFGTSTIHFSVKPQTHGRTQDQGECILESALSNSLALCNRNDVIQPFHT